MLPLSHHPPTALHLPLAHIWQGFGRTPPNEPPFHTALEQYLGVRACFTAASGRTALYLLLKALSQNSPERTAVLLPAYTCPALVKVILDVRLRPIPIDIRSDDMAFDQEQLVNHLNQKVLALIHVHPFGIPQPVEELMALAHAAGAVVIEDAAQAMGARWQGKQVGTVGDFGLFSLGPGKPLSVAGGGVICTNDEAWTPLLAAAWGKLPPPAPLTSAWALVRLLLVRLATHPRGWWLAARSGAQRWGEHERSWGYNVRPLTPLQSRIGTAQLSGLDSVNKVRYENGRQLAALLHPLDYVHIPETPPDSKPIYLRLPVVVDSAERREQLYAALWAANISAGRLYRHALPDIFPQLDSPPYPGAAHFAERLLTLPTHHYLTQADINRIGAIFYDAAPELLF